MTQNGIIFNSVKTGPIKMGYWPIALQGQQGPDEDGGIINAVDIDWNGAQVEENVTINTTGELLSWIKNNTAEEKLYKELYSVHLMDRNPRAEAPLTGYSERLSFPLTPKKQLFYDGIVDGIPEKIKNGVYTYNLSSYSDYLNTNMIALLDRKGGSAIQYDSNIKCIKLTPGQVFIKFPNNVEVYCIIVTAVAVKRSSSVADTTITPGLFSSSVSMEAISDNVEESPAYLFSFEKSHLESIKDPTTNRYQVITDNWGSDECYLYLKFTVGYNIKETETPAVS